MIGPGLGLRLLHRALVQPSRQGAFTVLRFPAGQGRLLTFPARNLANPAPKFTSPGRPSLSSFLQFAQTAIRNATYRDASAFRSRSPLRQPRPPNRRSPFDWLNSINGQVIFWGIIALNAGVFLAWQSAIATYRQTGDPSLLLFMRDNFLVNYKNVTSGRIWTLVTSCFSHQDVSHALFNGLTFFFMGPAVMGIMGNKRFLGLYLLGGVCCSLASLTWNRFFKHGVISSHGASGAIMAMIAFYACTFPRNTFYIFFVIPCPAWAFLPGILLFDGYRTLTDARTTTDTAGHVGGLLTGIAYYASRVALRR
ncbi:rhomboid-domain-containing protein [Leucogyrophana mollusca]|uniref:Rhomboid-domain-containing protein n=1 Tax=Leucogyrophana mollusca TaxID=85980 RepID=A0ACB8BXU6_9AGAM|nr:rhomboid-domain-containing protein [Leucogyrophana mollusca]